MVFADLTGLGVNREGGRGEADRYCILLPPTALRECVDKKKELVINQAEPRSL